MHQTTSTIASASRALSVSFVLFLTLLPTSLSAAPETSARAQAVEILQAARAAARAVDTVSFRFENGHAEAPFGWVKGTVKTRRTGDGAGGFLRVEGTFQAQPTFGRAAGFDFRFAQNAQEAAEWRSDRASTVRARLDTDPATANGLQGNASFGFLPEFFEDAPYWKELDLASHLEMAGTTEIGGVLCDVVRATLGSANGPVHQDWYFARSDRLPRGLLWWAEFAGQRAEMPFSVYDLQVNLPLADGVFQLPESTPKATEAKAPHTALLGKAAPAWTLRDASGHEVNLADYRGQVVVLDFWNTGCYLCHNALPQISALADELADEQVNFLALDIWEQGDAVAYWKAQGFSPRLLLAADEVAVAYGIAGQPAVVVVGPAGEILLSQVGFTEHRTARVRQAIVQGLARSSRSSSAAASTEEATGK